MVKDDNKKNQNETSDQDLFDDWVPLITSLMRFIQKTSYGVRLIFKITNVMEREIIINNINDSFKNIDYIPEFAYSEADEWFLISDNIKNLDSVHIFSWERKYNKLISWVIFWIHAYWKA